MKAYLENSEFINWNCLEIKEVARYLKGDLITDVEIAKACFEYVRDSIEHSWDIQSDIITCKASDVLRHKTGYCYAQSHLLAAILRANSIPAGLCYQRLTISEHESRYCLHGLNAVYLNDYGWYRLDSRGNNKNVQAEFTPPIEHLAYRTDGELESDIQGVWPEPLPVIVKTLQQHNTCQAVFDNLPDIELYS